MADLITTPTVVDPTDVRAVGINYVKATYPTWDETQPGDFTKVLLGAIASMIAYTATLSTQAETELVKSFGEIQGLPPLGATSAVVTSTWTLTDTAGHTIPAGTHVAIESGAGQTPITFLVQDAVTVAAGSATTAVGGVTLVADEPGADATGLTGSAVVLDSLAFVDQGTIALVGTTIGGQDGETASAYLARYTRFAQLLRPATVRPSDVVLFARVLFPRVARALAVDMYNPDTLATNVERCFTLYPIGPAGEALSAAEKSAILAALEASRESTFVFFVRDPTYTAIDITFVALAEPGNTPADVQARAVVALQQLVSPARHGIPSSSDQSAWVNRTKVYYQDAVTALNNVQGLDRYTTLTLNGAAADVTLAGVAPLPTPGTISGTVT